MEEQMNGLAAMGGVQPQITLEQVVEALMAGTSPDELMAMGVPEALIQEAMMQITKQTQPAPQEAGLAAMRIPQEGVIQ